MLIDQRALMSAYSTGSYAAGVIQICEFLDKFQNTSFESLTQEQAAQLDLSVEAIVYYLTRAEFSVSRDNFLRILSKQSPFTHLVGASSYDNTEAVVGSIFRKSVQSLPGILMHINRNPTVPAREKFFDLDSQIATEWYGGYFSATRTFINETVHENLCEHLIFWDERITLTSTISNAYMRSTYIDHTKDRLWRERFNKLALKNLKNVQVRNKPSNKRIALVTGRWAPQHPTYKNRIPIIRELAKHFDLTLVHCGPDRPDLALECFSDVRKVKLANGQFDLKQVLENDFGVVYYPDIGMNVESRFMSNIRLAPVQVMSNSHPVSTFGSEIDYFLTGIESESPMNPGQYYSERLILVPGIGTIPDKSGFVIRERGTERPSVVNRIACPWGSLKINPNLMERLRRIHKELDGKSHFVFFVSIDSAASSIYLLKKEIAKSLGHDSFTVYANIPYEKYMEFLSDCRFAVDAFPFGGNTSVLDCILSGIPIVCQKGWQFYNRAGPVALEKAGLEELVTHSEVQYVELAVRMFMDDSFNRTIRRKMQSVDPDVLLSSLGSVSSFVDAFKFMLDSGRGSDSKEPVVIK